MKNEDRRQTTEGGSANAESRTATAGVPRRLRWFAAAAAAALMLAAAGAAPADEPQKVADSATPATAAAPAAKPETTPTLDEVTVTAARCERDENTVPSSVTVITAGQIARSTAQSVPDLLRHEAGVSVDDWLGNGRTASVDVRGFGETGGTNTLVLVDGRRLNSVYANEVDWTAIPLERIERVEIVRGGAAVLYGDKAVGGVINIITKKGAEKNTATSETSVGSYRTLRQALGLAGREGPFTYAVNGSYRDGKGYRENGYFRNRTAGISLGFDDPKRCDWLTVALDAGVKEDRYGMPGGRWPGQDRRAAANPGDYAETRTSYLRLAPRLKLGDETHLDLGLEYGETEPMWKSPIWGGGRSRILEYALKPKLTTTREFWGLEHELTAGVDFTATERHPQRFSIFAPEYDITRTEAGYYLADTVALVPEQLFLDLGYRRSRVMYDYADAAVGNASYDLNSYRLGLTYAYAPGSKVFVSADRSFRTMLLSELGGPWGSPVALPPQTSWTYQAGVRHFFSRYATLGATVFEIDTTDEIFYDPNTWQNSNYPKTRRRGIELSAESDPLDTLHLFANYTWMNPRLGDGPYEGSRIPGVATHTVQAGATWSPLEQVDLDVRGRWIAGRSPISDWGNACGGWEGNRFTVVDAKLTYKPTKWLKLYVGCNNLFNEAYSEYGTWAQHGWLGPYEPYAYPSPKRNFIAGVVITKEF